MPGRSESTGRGALLRARREALGQSLEDVAEATRIPVSHLEAIEDDRLHDLPAGPYAAGYLRNLADHLGFEALPQGDSLPEPAPDPKDEPDGIGLGMDPSHGDGMPLGLVRGLAAVSVAALLVVFGRMVWQQLAELEGTAPEEPEPFEVRVQVERDTVLNVVRDGGTAIREQVARGDVLTYQAEASLELELDAVDDVRVFWNGSAVQPQGQQKAPRRLVFVDDVANPTLAGGRGR